MLINDCRIMANCLPTDYRWATADETELFTQGCIPLRDAILINRGGPSDGPFVDLAVPANLPVPGCIEEFDDHNDHRECQATLDNMNWSDSYDGWSDSTYDNLNTSGSLGFSVSM